MLGCKTKIKGNNGSVMLLAILVIAISSIFIGIVSSQSINKIKSTNSRTVDIESKYMAESGIELVVADIKYQIKEKMNSFKNKSTLRVNNEVPYISDIKTNLRNSKSYMELVKTKVGSAGKNTIENIEGDLDKLINTNSLQSKVYYDGIESILNDIIDLLYSTKIDDDMLILIYDDTYSAIEQLHKALTRIHKYVWYYEKHYINIDNNHKHLSPLLEWDPQEPWTSQNANASKVRDEIIEGFRKEHWQNSVYKNVQDIIYINEVQNNSKELMDAISKQIGELNTLLTSDGIVNGNPTIWVSLGNIANTLQNNNKDSETANNAFNTAKNSINNTVDKITDEMLKDVYKIVIFNRKYVNKSLLVDAIRGLEHIKYDIIETADRLNFFDETKEEVEGSEQIETISIFVKKPMIVKARNSDEIDYNFEKDIYGKNKGTEYILNVIIQPNGKFEVNSKDIDITSKSKLYNNKNYELNTSIKISASGEISDSGNIGVYTFNHNINSYNRQN